MFLLRDSVPPWPVEVNDGREVVRRVAYDRTSPSARVSILERQRTPMCFSDLTTQGQTNSRPIRFCGEERDEQVRGVLQARTFILDADFHESVVRLPRR